MSEQKLSDLIREDQRKSEQGWYFRDSIADVYRRLIDIVEQYEKDHDVR